MSTITRESLPLIVETLAGDIKCYVSVEYQTVSGLVVIKVERHFPVDSVQVREIELFEDEFNSVLSLFKECKDVQF